VNVTELRALVNENGRAVPRRHVDLVPGDRWAYRERGTDALAEVAIVRVGIKTPPRVRVRWVDDQFEGREDWVPPDRLKVPWPDRETFRAWEERWRAVREPADDVPEPVRYAADQVIGLLVAPEVATTGYNAQNGVIKIYDPDGLAAFLAIEGNELRSAPAAFEEEGALVASMTTLVRVAQRAAELHPDAVLLEVEREEADIRRAAVHGRSYGRRGGHDWTEPEVCVRIETDFNMPRLAILREWCGDDTRRHDEFVEIREEARRLARLVRSAIDVMGKAGLSPQASKLEKELNEALGPSATGEPT
jgi:hypothetical protein